MNLVFCTRYFSRGGGATGQYVHELVSGLLARDPGVTISVVASDEVYRVRDNATEAETNEGRLRIQRLRSPQIKVGGLVGRLMNDAAFTIAVFLRLVLARKLDCVVVYTSPFLLPAGVRLACLIRRVPYVYVIHDIYPESLVASDVARDQALFVRLLRRLQKRWLDSATAVVVLGRCMVRTLTKVYRVDTKRLHVIPHWPNPVHGGPLIRQGEPASTVTIIYGGNLGFAQDLATVLGGASLAQAQNLKVTFSFVVSGNHVERWKAAAVDRGLHNVGFQPAVPYEEYSGMVESADIGLIALRRGFAGLAVPSKLYNLLAAGKPIIAVVEAFSEIAMVIEEHRCGFRVEPGDDHGFYAAVEALADNPSLRAEMGHRARHAAERDFPMSLAVERFHHMIQEVRNAAS